MGNVVRTRATANPVHCQEAASEQDSGQRATNGNVPEIVFGRRPDPHHFSIGCKPLLCEPVPPQGLQSWLKVGFPGVTLRR
jgi:hypothetical protein